MLDDEREDKVLADFGHFSCGLQAPFKEELTGVKLYPCFHTMSVCVYEYGGFSMDMCYMVSTGNILAFLGKVGVLARGGPRRDERKRQGRLFIARSTHLCRKFRLEKAWFL